MKYLKRLLVAFIKLAVIFVLLVSAMTLYAWYESRDLEKYCSSAIGTSVESVREATKVNQFVLLSEDEQKITLLNQRAPYFRTGCTFEIESKMVKSSNFFAAD